MGGAGQSVLHQQFWPPTNIRNRGMLFVFIIIIGIPVCYIIWDMIFDKPNDPENVWINFAVHEDMVKEGMHPFYWYECPFCKYKD